MKTMLIILSILIGLAVIGLMVKEQLLFTHKIVASPKYSFYLPYNYDIVRRVLVRTNAMEKLVESENGQIIEQDWQGFSLSTDKILNANWLVEASGIFKVRVRQEYLNETIKLKLRSTITREEMLVTITSLAPAGYMNFYSTTIQLKRQGDRTLVCIWLSIEAQFTAPKSDFIKQQVQQQLKKEAEKSVLRTQKTLQVIIDQYKDKKIILSIPVSKKDNHRNKR